MWSLSSALIARSSQALRLLFQKICCMYTAKHAQLYKHHVPDGRAYVFYIDIRPAARVDEESRCAAHDGQRYALPACRAQSSSA